MATVNASMDDKETVVIRVDDKEFFGIAHDELDEEFEDRGLKGGVVTVVELTLRPEAAAELLQALAKLARFS